MFKDKTIVVGITGGIAAAKASSLCSQLTQQGANVIPVITRSALKMVGAVTLRGLTGKDPLVEVFDEPFPNKIAHIHLADIAHLIVIAPATANFIAKHCAGIADDMLSNILLATSDRSKILFCPAMNVNMLHHPATQRNIKELQSWNINFIAPDSGHLACGYEAEGRLPETAAIIREMNLMSLKIIVKDQK